MRTISTPVFWSSLLVRTLLEHLAGAQKRHAAARQDAFLDGRAGRMHGVIDPILALLHLDLARPADPDDRDAAGELGQPLLQLLAIVVGGGLLDLGLDLADAAFDVGLLAGAVDDGGVLLLDGQLLGAPQHGERDVLELDAEVLADGLATGQDRDVLQHGLAAIPEAGRLDGRDLEAAAQLVDHQRRERLALDLLGDDHQRLGGLHHGFQEREELLQAGELLLVNENVGVFHLDPHLLGIGDEVGGDVAAVELHAFDHLELGLQRLRLLDRDHALVADFLHGLGEEAADLGIAVGRDGPDLGDLLVGGDLLGVLLQVGDHRLDRQIDATLEIHRVHAGGDRLGAFPDDGVSQHGRGGGAVTGLVGGLGGDLAHHLGAHVLELVLELDLLGDGDAVLGDAGRAERLVEHDVAALGAERHLHGIAENIDAAQHPVAGIDREFHVLG